MNKEKPSPKKSSKFDLNTKLKQLNNYVEDYFKNSNQNMNDNIPMTDQIY